MYIFYSICLLFIPFVTRTILKLKNKKESSLILFIGIISIFSLIYSPFLALEVLKYYVDLVLSWIIFSFIFFFISFFLIESSIKYIKNNSAKDYKDLIKYVFNTNLIPFFLCLVFFISMFYINYGFDDQYAYTNISIYYRDNILSFNNSQKLPYFYVITAGYFANSAFGINGILQIYSMLWNIIPIFIVINGCNDFLLSFYKKDDKKWRYFLTSSILLILLFVLSYPFFWAYGSGNTLLQASIIFIAIYLLRIYKNLSFVFFTTTFLIYFSPTGILLTTGLIIVSFLYVVIFKKSKYWIYWLSYLFYALGPILSACIGNHYYYILFDLVSLSTFVSSFILINQFKFKWLEFDFINVYDQTSLGLIKHKNLFANWIFNRSNLNFLFISIMFFFVIMTFTLYETINKSQYIYSGLNYISLIINLIIFIAFTYKILKHNEYNQTIFILFFFIIACFICSLFVHYMFFDNQSTWRISYLCIGFSVPLYYFGIFGISYYKEMWNRIFYLLNSKNQETIKHKYKNKIIYGSIKTKVAISCVTIFTISIVYDVLSIPTYPITVSPNISNNKYHFNYQEQQELLNIKNNITSNTNIISDVQAVSYMQTGRNADTYLLNSVSGIQKYFSKFKTWSNPPLPQMFKQTDESISTFSSWQMIMYNNFEYSVLHFAMSYYNTSQVNSKTLSEELQAIYNSSSNLYLKNFMNNTFYGSNYVRNFEHIIQSANNNENSKNTSVKYLIFNSNTSYFKSYENDGLFSYLQKVCGYKIIDGDTSNIKNNQTKLDFNQPYLYILER